jgi:hypothetical protein
MLGYHFSFKKDKYNSTASREFPPPKEGFHTVDRFCQYIILTQFDQIIGSSIKVSDLYKDLDMVLENTLY